MKALVLAGVAAIAIGSTAEAADMSAPSAAAVVSAFSWTGFYAGAHVGYGQFNDTVTVGNFGLPGPGVGVAGRFGFASRHSLLGGLYAGANYQVGSAVAGIEADIDFVGYNGRRTPAAVAVVPADSFSIRNNIQWSVRGRLGYAAGPVLLYLTAGAAFANFGTSYFDGVLNNTISFSQTRIGLTAGAGIDYAFTPNVIGRIEYRYTDFGTMNVDTTQPVLANFWQNRNIDHEIKQHSIRFGVSYLFSTGGSAVVARY